MVLHELWYLSDEQNEGSSLSVEEGTPCTSQENIETNDIKEEMPQVKYNKEEEMPQVKYNKEEEMKKCLTMLNNHSQSKHLTASVPDSKHQRRYKRINFYTCNLIFEKRHFIANFDQMLTCNCSSIPPFCTGSQ